VASEYRPNGSIPRWVAWLVAQGVINSVYCRITVFGSIFVLFLNELGLSKSRTGLALSLIPFSHLLGLVIAPAVARFGCKRAYVLGFGVRNAFVALMLLTPWVRVQYGLSWAFVWVSANLLGFALSRAFGEMGMSPWFQEVIPNAVRGRIGAVTSTLGTGAGLVASIVAGNVINHGQGVSRYLGILGFGVLLGIVATSCLLFVPGGDPVLPKEDQPAHRDGMRQALRDRAYARYLAGFALVTLALGALLSFAPLYMRERVGLPTGTVVLLDVAGAIGGLLAGYPAGRSADRRGSRPVLIASVSMLALLPVLWTIVPQRSALSYISAMAISLYCGGAYTAWLLGADRYLNVCAVPPAKRTPYMAVFYAVAGVSAGAGPLLAGWLVDACTHLGGSNRHALLNPYAPLFAVSLALLAVALLVLAGVPDAEADEAHASRRTRIAKRDGRAIR
jgi:MFS family permease